MLNVTVLPWTKRCNRPSRVPVVILFVVVLPLCKATFIYIQSEKRPDVLTKTLRHLSQNISVFGRNTEMFFFMYKYTLLEIFHIRHSLPSPVLNFLISKDSVWTQRLHPPFTISHFDGQDEENPWKGERRKTGLGSHGNIDSQRIMFWWNEWMQHKRLNTY